MQGLNSQQRDAVLHARGPLLVIAGAGSGKTRSIIEKIQYLIAENHYPAGSIAAITFTNKSAKEMQERLQQRIGKKNAQDVMVCTFHALGLRFLQIEHAAAGLKRGFSIFDTDDTTGVLKDILFGADKNAVERVRQSISQTKQQLIQSASVLPAQAVQSHNATEAYTRYQNRLAAFNAIDFDDLLRLPVSILSQNPEILSAWRQRIRYLLVDEYQDTNLVQYEFIKLIAGKEGNFSCVGDDDQSIYSWRGANPENLTQLQKDYPSLKVIKLEQNYRCSNRVLRTANALIAHNPHLHVKKLWSHRDDGDRVRIWECADSEHEAEKVAAEIAYLAQSKSAVWSDVCILFRSNFQSRPFEKALQFLRIPYHLNGGTVFLERQEVKDVLAWLRLIVNPSDDRAFLRAVQAPKRDVGAQSLEKLAELAAQKNIPLSRVAESVTVLQQLSSRAAQGLSQFTDTLLHLRRQAQTIKPSALVREVTEASGILKALQNQSKDPGVFAHKKANLEDLADWFDSGPEGAGFGDLAAQLALISRNDAQDKGNQVRMMSLHASKGLEFRFVFIVGCEDGVLPHQTSIDDGQLEEERRLFYVGITRTQQQLYLSYSKKAYKFGEIMRLEPSRFFKELPAQEVQWDGADPQVDAQQKKERARAHLSAIKALFD